MMALLSPRLWLALGLAAVLALSHGFAYKSGRAAVRSAWDKERAEQMAAALVASENARAKEQVLIAKTQKVSADYVAEKKRRATDNAVAADRLRELQTALSDSASAGTTTAGGTSDPRNAIIYQCSSALTGMDSYAKEVAGIATALQHYAASVCVTP